MKAFNLKKIAAKSEAATTHEKMLADQRKDMGQTVEKQGTPEKNINLSLPVKNKDNTVPFNVQLGETRKKETEFQITEASMNKKEVSFGEQKDKLTDINAKTKEYDDKKEAAYKKAQEAKGDTAFWDKYVGVQLEGKKTTVPKNAPESGSQLPNKNAKEVMSLVKDADAMLYHIQATAKHESRELTADEKQQIVDIIAGKNRLLAGLTSVKVPDPSIKMDRDGVVRVYEADGTSIDEFKSCAEAKASYPEGDIADE